VDLNFQELALLVMPKLVTRLFGATNLPRWQHIRPGKAESRHMLWRDSSASHAVRRGATLKEVVPSGVARLFRESRRVAWRDST